MSDNHANPFLRPPDAAEGAAVRRPPAWAGGNAYPPGRDAIQRLAEKRIAEKRRARRKQAAKRVEQ